MAHRSRGWWPPGRRGWCACDPWAWRSQWGESFFFSPAALAAAVRILSAVETVNPKIRSTLDAAILSKMAEREQIRGGVVDGPLAMDNAISLTSARTKGVVSVVAGRADVLVVPNLEAGNILAKELTYAAQAEGAGLVLGAKVPIMLTSRADDERSRLFSCVVAVLYDAWRVTGRSAVPAPPRPKAEA